MKISPSLLAGGALNSFLSVALEIWAEDRIKVTEVKAGHKDNKDK